MTRSITLLGPQRRPTLDRVVAGLSIDGRIAAINAGWQERESDDAELMALLGGRGTNLRLHSRWLDVLARDSEYAHAEREHAVVLDELQQLYLIRLDHALGAAYEVAQRVDGHPRIRDTAYDDALSVVRLIDEMHLERVRQLQAEFFDAWVPHEREAVARHRAEVQQVLSQAACMVIAGGHVGEIMKVLHLFNVAPGAPDCVIAWSAGAMALTDRVVLFHDHAAQGRSQTEVFDRGIGLVQRLVLMPHARRRLRTEDQSRMSVLARRFAPSICVVLDDGVSVQLGDDGALPPDARIIEPDGRIVELAAAG